MSQVPFNSPAGADFSASGSESFPTSEKKPYLHLAPGVAPMTFRINSNNHPSIGGVDLVELAATHGTPLYVLDGRTIRTRGRAYKDGMDAHYSGGSLVLFAAKANLNLGLCRLVEQEGLGLDVVSGGELYTAIQAGFPMERVLFNGNNKSREELQLAIHHGVHRISVDNFHDLTLIHDICASSGKTANIVVRVAPGIEAHTHDYLKTGTNDNKFGFSLPFLSEVLDLLQTTYKDTITLKGLHAHIGSQIFDLNPFEDLVQIMLNIYYNIRQEYGLVLEDLDIGGGLGIHYTSADDPPEVAAYTERLANKLKTYAERLDYPLPRILMEPGRSLVATAGVTLYTVGSRKDIPHGRTFIAVDGGMGDNIRPALYGAEYTAAIANKITEPVAETITLVGKYCESGDVLIKEMQVPKVESGDTVVVFGTGAYNYTMSSNYNRIPRPAMVLVENNTASVLVRRETWDDVVARDIIPSHLETVAEKIPDPLPVKVEKPIEVIG